MHGCLRFRASGWGGIRRSIGRDQFSTQRNGARAHALYTKSSVIAVPLTHAPEQIFIASLRALQQRMGEWH